AGTESLPPEQVERFCALCLRSFPSPFSSVQFQLADLTPSNLRAEPRASVVAWKPRYLNLRLSAGKRLQESEQVGLLLLCQLKLKNQIRLVLSLAAALVIKLDDFFETLERAVVCVGCGKLDVAQRGCLECAAVFLVFANGIAAAILRLVWRGGEHVKLIVGQVVPIVARGTRGLADEQYQPALFLLGQSGLVAAEIAV